VRYDVIRGPLPNESVELPGDAAAFFLTGNRERDVLSPRRDRDGRCNPRLGFDEVFAEALQGRFSAEAAAEAESRRRGP
jgi:hypothetical protein